MSVNVKCDCSQLKSLYRKLNREAEYIQFMESIAKELAMRLLAMVKKRTPVGIYPEGEGQTGGTLRRGWVVGAVKKRGDIYEAEVFNSVKYASHVEYGHRQTPGRFVRAIGKRLKASWVPGRFMMTISEQELQTKSTAIIERKIKKKLAEVWNGK